MIVQIPVKNGYDGGSLRVSHRGETRIFDHSSSSNQLFYSTIFYSGCQYELSEVTRGWRLVLSFKLYWKWNRSLFMPLPAEKSFLLVAKEIRTILSAWHAPVPDQQRLLAIPLEHVYTVESLSFAGLKGRDRLMASLLNSVEFIDLQLASVRRTVKIETNTWNADHIQEDKEDYHVECWFSARTNSTFAFQDLQIDFNSELALPMFPHTESLQFANQTESNTTDSNYYEAVLVIWPKTSTIDLACRYGIQDESFTIFKSINIIIIRFSWRPGFSGVFGNKGTKRKRALCSWKNHCFLLRQSGFRLGPISHTYRTGYLSFAANLH